MSRSRRLLNRAVLAASRWVERHGAIQPGTDLADTFGTFGAGSYVAHPTATLYGARSIHVGEDTLIGKHCSLLVGYAPDDVDLPERGLVIGDRCVVGARNVFTAHESIEIGDDVWFGQNVFISDASHGYQDPETPIGVQLGRHQRVVVGSGSWIGHGAILLPGTTIGRNVVVAGVPAKPVRRLVPGVGWLNADGTDLRPSWSTEQVAAMLAGAPEPPAPPIPAVLPWDTAPQSAAGSVQP